MDKIPETELHAWMDGELPRDREPAIEAYLAAHPEVARRWAAYRADSEAMRRIFGRVDRLPDPRATRVPARHWAAAVAVVVASFSGGWALHGWPFAEPGGTAREAALLHAGQADAPAPLAPADKATLALALARVVDASITLPSMEDLGYRLGAVQPVSSIDRGAVQLIYTGTDRPITVYLRRKPGAAETPLAFARHGEVLTAWWDLKDLTCAISGVVNQGVLEAFGRRLYQALDRG